MPGQHIPHRTARQGRRARGGDGGGGVAGHGSDTRARAADGRRDRVRRRRGHGGACTRGDGLGQRAADAAGGQPQAAERRSRVAGRAGRGGRRRHSAAAANGGAASAAGAEDMGHGGRHAVPLPGQQRGQASGGLLQRTGVLDEQCAVGGGLRRSAPGRVDPRPEGGRSPARRAGAADGGGGLAGRKKIDYDIRMAQEDGQDWDAQTEGGMAAELRDAKTALAQARLRHERRVPATALGWFCEKVTSDRTSGRWAYAERSRGSGLR
eukprot:5627688-Prymnesium_polylepis.1